MTVKKRPLIGLVCSMPEEGRGLVRSLKQRKTIQYRQLRFSQGLLAGTPSVIVFSGIGKTNAAYAAASMIGIFCPSMIIGFGAGGAYPSSDLNIGDIAVATSEIYGDEGVETSKGFLGMEYIGIPLARKGGTKYFNSFPLDRRMARQTFKAAMASDCPGKEAEKGFSVMKGPFVTVSTCTGTRRKARELEKRYGAICENMEGAAIVHVCAMHRLPVAEMRGISNIVEDRDRGKWDIRLAAANCRRSIIAFMKRDIP